jgi:hypothetical protein
MGEVVDRRTGEICPPVESFDYYELGTNGLDGKSFRRGQIVQSKGFLLWRDQYKNTGVYRSLYASNTDKMLENNPEILFYGGPCFDLDTPKGQEKVLWPELIKELQDVLIPAIREDFELRASDLRIWFSGGRGIHLEIPPEALGVWPDNQINVIHGYYARSLVQRLGLKFLDLSLYGSKRLYRLEYSLHQSSGLYKQPLRHIELPAIADDFAWMERFARRPRKQRPEDLFTVPKPSSKGLSFYAMLARQALESTRVIGLPIQNSERRREHYDRTRFKCVEKMMTPGETVPGGRNTMAFYFTNHLADNGFSFEEAVAEMELWASDHCDPPMTSKSERLEWMRMLERAYEEKDSTSLARPGCRYIQQNFPTLCQESICPIAALKRSQQRSP